MTGNNDFYIREGVDLYVQHAKVYFFTKEIEKLYFSFKKIPVMIPVWMILENCDSCTV